MNLRSELSVGLWEWLPRGCALTVQTALVALLALTSSVSATGSDLIELVTNAQPQCVFGAGDQRFFITWRNSGQASATEEVRGILFQTTTATAVRIGTLASKTVAVLPGQTVLNSVRADFPQVKAESKFLIEWVSDTNRILGKTEILVYPTNLLAELKPLLSGETLGVLDPTDQLKPLLKRNGVELVDLSERTLAEFSGKLAILGPFASKTQRPDDLAKSAKAMAKNGSAVLWFDPPPSAQDGLKPSFYSVSAGAKTVVVANADLVAELQENPRSQKQLLALCRMAINPQTPGLPGEESLP